MRIKILAVILLLFLSGCSMHTVNDNGYDQVIDLDEVLSPEQIKELQK